MCRTYAAGISHLLISTSLLIAVGSGLIGCSGDDGAPDSVPIATSEPLPAGAGPEERAAAKARELYAAERGITAQAAAVTSIEEVSWNDASLGCPEPGMSYAQVLTPGYRIIVEGAGDSVTYHAEKVEGDREPLVVHCESSAALPGSNALGGPALEQAIADLESRLGSSAEITVDDSFVAPIARLACDGTPPPSTPESGPRKVILQFQLRSGDTVHVYRAWGDEILYCGTTEDLVIE